MSGLALLEEALHLFRRDLAGNLAVYWIATAPFIAGLLYFWSDMSSAVDASWRLLPASLLLTGLWIWMVTGHAIFCSRLFAGVSGIGASSLSVLRIAFRQTAVQGFAPIGLSIAALLLVPAAWIIAYFQNCSVFAGDRSFPAMTAAARKQSTLWQKQNWELLLALCFLALIMFLNLWVACIVGAQLLQSFFGITTPLTRSQWAYFNPTLLFALASFTFMAVDPLMKAAYVIRCFKGESLQTGADLRLALRTVLMLLVLLIPSGAAEQKQYDKAIDEVLHRPEYQWRNRVARESRQSPAQEFFRSLTRWLDDAIQALVDFLRKFSPKPSTPAPVPGSPQTVQIAMTVASLLVLIAIAVIAMRYWRVSQSPKKIATAITATAVDVTDESVTPDALPEEEWFKLAEQLASEGDLRLALRALFLGALAQLNRQGHITITRHKTNLEYDRELARRTRTIPSLRPAFLELMRTFERSWYGAAPVDHQVLAQARQSLPALRSQS